VPGVTALLLSLAGALGLGPVLGGAGGAVTVVDVSPSCEPLEEVPDDAVLCRDSRLGQALDEAARRGAKRIHLFTDGCDLYGAPPKPPPVPVDVTLLPRRDDVMALALRAPDRIPVGTDFAVEVVVGRTRGRDAPPVTAAVTVFRDGERVGSPVAVRLERGQAARALVRDRVDREGVVRYRAVLEDPVGDPADDAIESLVRVGEKPLVVVVGGALDAPGLEVRPVPAAQALSAPFDAADAIVVLALPDAPAQEKIADAVRAGAGLVLVGGRGVAGGPLEKVLPLTDAPPEGRATVLLLDVSGSMDELMLALANATARLLREFQPDDQVAFVFFADRPVDVIPWRRVADAKIDFSGRRGAGNTLLEPAVAEAQRLLAEAKGDRRLFVVSDGKWKDLKSRKLRERLDRFGGTYRAALFVQDVPSEDWDGLFSMAITAKDDLAAALLKIEAQAPDRNVRAADAATSPAPPWLEGAVLRDGRWSGLVRLYRRGVGETVVVHVNRGEIPIVAAWRPGGKVVMAGTTNVTPPIGLDVGPLVRAVLKDTGDIRLRAWREGDEVVAEANGSDGAPFVFDGVTVPARPVGPGRWRATARHATRVACGAATVLVARVDAEFTGLANRPDIAATIVVQSGGALVEAGGRGGARAAAVFVTLLLAAALVVVSAWKRTSA